MTRTQAEHIVMCIYQNEGRTAGELTDSELAGYLLDHGQEDSQKNIKALRKV